jgi:hypothetical protein
MQPYSETESSDNTSNEGHTLDFNEHRFSVSRP